MASMVVVHGPTRGSDQARVATRMLQTAPHRGSCWATGTEGCATVGVSWDSAWPRAWIASGDGHLAAFAGALDNDAELRDQLRREGITLEDATPATTVLAAVRTWGPDAVARLRGVFTGAVVAPDRTFVFRDHFGFRPLFLHTDGPVTVVATEVKQVLAGWGRSPEPDLDHLEAVLYGGVGSSTAFTGVRRVPSRTIVELQADGEARQHVYWTPSRFVETNRVSVSEAIEGVADHLDRAVQRMLTGRDVILVSGGLDSPSLAAFASTAGRAAAHAPRLATGIYPDHPSMDERPYTRALGEYLGIPVHEFTMRAAALDDVHEWVELADGPTSTLSLPECAQSYRVARELGGRTVLTGELAENVFMGRSFLLDHLVAHGRVPAVIRQARAFRLRGKPTSRIVRECLRGLVPGPVINRYVHSHSPRMRHLPPWIDPDVVRERDAGRRVPGPRRRWQSHQTSSFEGSGAGFEADEICAASIGVEVRRPFADIDLWQYVLGLPAETKVPPDPRDKALLRDSMSGRLPEVIRTRSDKTYFDDYQLAHAEYTGLRKLLDEPLHRVRGVDYDLLRQRLESEDMGTGELNWTRDLARIHAFLQQWGPA